MTTKMIICLIGILSFTAIVSAQIPFSIEDPAMDAWAADLAHRPVFTGKLINYTEEDLKNNPITCSFPVPTLNFNRKINLTVDADGSFRYQMPYAIPYQGFWFTFGNLYSGGILVSEGLHIELDVSQLKRDTVYYPNPGVRFSGMDGVTAGLLNEFSNFTEKADISLSTEKREIIYPEMPPEEKVAKLRLLYHEVFEVENHFFETHDKKTQAFLTNKRQSDFYADVLLVYFMKRIEMPAALWQEVVEHQPYGINESGQEYYRVLGSYATISTKKLFTSDILKRMPARKADMVILAGMSKIYDTEEQKEYYESGMALLQGSWAVGIPKTALQEIDFTLAEIKKKEANATLRSDSAGKLPGIPYRSYQHGAELYTSAYGDIDSLFEHIRAFYPGKAIIFDIWTTWCAPCKKDMKESKPKKEEIKKAGLPVEIIYLCYPSRSSMEKWTFIINENEFTGTHFYLSDVQAKQLKERYNIMYFPTYLTFTRKGKLDVDAVNGISDIDIEVLKEKI